MLGHDAARSGATAAEIRPPFARKWYRAFPDEGIMAGVQPIVAQGLVFVPTLRGTVHAINAQTGEEAWTYRGGSPILHSVAVGGGCVVFGAADGRICGIDASSGKVRWTVQTKAGIWNAPAIVEGVAVVGSRDGNLYAIEIAMGRTLWTGQTGGAILNSPAIDAKTGRVYVGGEDMRVYAFDLRDGKPVWMSPKLPGVSFRGYHPVIAPDGSVMVTVTPHAGGDAIQNIMLDMVKEVFGDFASWRHKKEENDRIRKENFELMKKPVTYPKQLDYLRKRLTEEPALRTFFVLDGETGRPRFVAPIVYAESMNGPMSPPVVTGEGKVIVKYSALLRSRYEHYSPFLNVGYLDTKTGHITPIMDPSRTYGWHDSLLLVHDEQCQLSVGGKVLFNTHQDNVNAMDLETLKGYGAPMCHNVHEVQPGAANSLWAVYLSGRPMPMGWEWLARGTAVYGGGSVIDVPIAIDGDSFYFLPTHEINAGVVVLGYKMDPNGKAANRDPEPKEQLTTEQWEKIKAMKWDWDTLGMPRLNTVLQKGLPEKVRGTRQLPLVDEAKQAVAAISDEQLDAIIFRGPSFGAMGDESLRGWRTELARAVDELISTRWQPLLFPAGKHPTESYRLFVDPMQTLYTLGMAYPHLPEDLQRKVSEHVAGLSAAGGTLAGATGARMYDFGAGQVRSAYDPAPAKLLKIDPDLVLSETARLYPLWLWANVTGDWRRLERDWPALRDLAKAEAPKDEPDMGNGRLSGLMAACRIARKLNDSGSADRLVRQTRVAIRSRLEYELAHTQGGLITTTNHLRALFGRWRNLTPDVARLLATHAKPVHQQLMDVYVDHHRPTWFVAWNVELLWRNECPFSFPGMSLEIFSAKAMVLGGKPEGLGPFVDLPWCRADEFYIQKLALLLNSGGTISWR
jgi:hypothetical protein